MHIFIVWGLAYGLSRANVEVLKGPLEADIIEMEEEEEEVEPPPPPPDFEPPPPDYIPPPELAIDTPVETSTTAIQSVTGVWRGAEFLEREVFDMMGITFTGHPDLRRILMPEDYAEGYPLRKDFPTEGRGWRSQFDFIPRLDEAPEEMTQGEYSEAEKKPFISATGAPGSSKSWAELCKACV